MTLRRPRIRVTRDGRYELRLPASERALLRTLPGQLRDLLSSTDPALERLFPPAHPDDPDLDNEYREMVSNDLMQGRLSALDIMERTLDAELLDEEELTSWLHVLNDLRLVLGTRLDVTEDLEERAMQASDPRAPAFELYRYLTFLESHVIDALAESLQTELPRE